MFILITEIAFKCQLGELRTRHCELRTANCQMANGRQNLITILGEAAGCPGIDGVEWQLEQEREQLTCCVNIHRIVDAFPFTARTDIATDAALCFHLT